MRRRTALVWAAAAGVVLAGAGSILLGHAGSDASAVRSATPPAEEPNSERVNWDLPFGDGLRLKSIPEAAARLAFTPAAGTTVGPPAAVYVHRRVRSRREQGLALVYQHPTHGRFFVFQSPTKLSQAGLEAIAAGCRPERGCEGTWTVEPLANGTRALVVAGPVSSVVMWLRRGIRYVVVRPSESLSIGRAKDLAAEFARG